jgi:hypothetical protein
MIPPRSLHPHKSESLPHQKPPVLGKKQEMDMEMLKVLYGYGQSVLRIRAA